MLPTILIRERLSFSWWFQVKREGGKEMGTIKKQRSGLFKKVLPDADHFGLTFSPQLDANAKALIFAAAFLIVSTLSSSLFPSSLGLPLGIFFSFLGLCVIQ